LKAVLLAAGEGRRLLPLTRRLPKPLIEVGGETLIERHVGALVAAGVSECHINVCHLAEMIVDRMGDGARYGARFHFHREDRALETGGGIRRMLPQLGDAPFIVVSADIYCQMDMAALRRVKLPAHASGCLLMVDNPAHNPGGDYAAAGGWLTPAGRDRLTYSGIGIFRPALFESVPVPRFPLRDVFVRAIDEGRLAASRLPVSHWTDVGTADRLEALRTRAARL